MNNEAIFRKGQLILLTSGEYSSYGIQGAVIALRDFNESDMPMKLSTPRFGDPRPNPDIDKMIADKWIEETDTPPEIWLRDQ